jgi:hypothetical protein
MPGGTAAACEKFLRSRAVRPTEELIRMGRVPVDFGAELDVRRGAWRTLNRRPERFHFIETGAPGGKFSAVIPYWAGNRYDIHRPVDRSVSTQHQGRFRATNRWLARHGRASSARRLQPGRR